MMGSARVFSIQFSVYSVQYSEPYPIPIQSITEVHIQASPSSMESRQPSGASATDCLRA